jgi:hypothetical protein
MSRKRSYVTPSLTSYGSIAKLTQGTSGDGGGGGGITIPGIGIMIMIMIML